ncbi:unnamed protein product [Nippostrongylus brasiliensis]|uniref:MFS domain-containing protein n=1 Tax=Nippostrongylus brasiliensis TaxID=27835 RepID=A0A0N4YX46_NIPBR|nr:unnamed protein product [Nippostrongylus brasiliensis]
MTASVAGDMKSPPRSRHPTVKSISSTIAEKKPAAPEVKSTLRGIYRRQEEYKNGLIMETVDPTASETFFGIITAAFSVGQGLASPIFGFWMNRSKSVRWPMICGITVMIVSNVIFCFVEAFKEKERRWVMMVAR